MRTMITGLVSLLLACLTIPRCADYRSGQSASSHLADQQERKRLTNADVVGMVKGGLPESTIVLVIEQNSCEFDISPTALVELKNQGISPAVMKAMMRAKDTSTALQQSTTQAGSDPKQAAGVGLLAEGAYYKGPNGWVKLEQIRMAGGGATHMAKMFVPGLTPQLVWTFRGAEAPVDISEPRPAFYFKQSPYLTNIPGYSERDIVLVRFDKKKDHRELQTTSGGNMLTFKSGFSKEKTPDIVVTRLSETIFQVVPNNDLQPGQYLLTFSGTVSSGYDFGVTANK